MKTEKIFYERLNKVFDTLNINNLKIDNNLFKNYDYFSRNYLDDVEEVVELINKGQYLWVQIDDSIVDINIINIIFDSTQSFYNHTYIDVYKITYENELTETISSSELLELKTIGAIKRKNGVIGLDKNITINLVDSYQTNI